MSKRNNTNDIHTNTEKLPFAIKALRIAIKGMNIISSDLAVSFTTKLFCKPQRTPMKAKHEAFYNTGKTETLNIRGFEVKMFVKGNGPLVFVNHGWNSLGYAMRNIVNELTEKGYKVVMPDMPCHGRSSGTYVDQIEMGFVLEEILLHYNSIQPIQNIVTHSWGGTATLLALDNLYKKCPNELSIQKMVAISMPSNSNAIMDIFCETLDLPAPVRMGLSTNLELITFKANRTLAEAFPITMNSLLRYPPFEILLIHDKKDMAIDCKNSIELAAKFPKVELQLTDNLGHINILKDEVVRQLAVNHLELEYQFA